MLKPKAYMLDMKYMNLMIKNDYLNYDKESRM